MATVNARDGASLFRPGRNCWRVERARRFSLLIDAQEYFGAFLSSLERARHRVVIAGWDIDARVRLAPGVTLGQAVLAALAREPGLGVRVLCWDFAMLYSLQRQLFPNLRRAFRHPRVEFVLDGCHPFGASHHQKVVLVDEALAFVGGLDLCGRRWDTRLHLPWDRRRVDVDGEPYEPFHDVHSVVQGDAARALGDLLAERWYAATGRPLDRPALGDGPSGAGADAWPAGVAPQFTDVELAIARTLSTEGPPLGPAGDDVQEIEALYLDQIASARRRIYIENQYLSSARVGEALAARLREEDPPEILVLAPRRNLGWLERVTMGMLRARLLKRLRAADRHGRLRVLYPVVRAPGRAVPISLHSKFLVVDETSLRVGSSNLSNRSMGLDSEVDVAIAAQPGSHASRRIGELRDSLLAEHLGVEPAEVSDAIAREGSLFGALDAIGARPGRARELRPLPARWPVWLEWWVPDDSVLDPPHPIERDPYFGQFVPVDRAEFLARKFRWLQARVAAAWLCVAFAALPGLRVIADPADSLARLEAWASAPNALGWALAGVAAGALAFVPADLLVVAACLVAGPGLGWVLSLAGAGLSTAISYLAGRWVGGQPRAAEVSAEAVGRGGFWPAFLLHLSLVQAHSAIAFRAGRLRTPFLRFLNGALLGQMFRVATVVFFFTFWIAALEKPRGLSLVALVPVSLLVLALFRWSGRKLLPVYQKRGHSSSWRLARGGRSPFPS